MKKFTFRKAIAVALFIIVVAGCQEETINVTNSNAAPSSIGDKTVDNQLGQ